MYRRLVATHLLLFGLFMAGVASFNYAFDPFQRFRVTREYPIPFAAGGDIGNASRYIAPGLARNYPHDTLVIGNSLAAGFSHELIERHIPGRALKLTIGGATGRELFQVASLALEHRRPRRVIWILDTLVYDSAADRTAPGFPAHQYQGDLWSDALYLVDFSTLRLSARAARERYPEVVEPSLNEGCPEHTRCGSDNGCRISRAFIWKRGCPEQKAAYYHEHRVRPQLSALLGGYRTLVPAGSTPQYEPVPAVEMIQNLEQNLGALIAAYPKVHFGLVLPPYSMVYWALHGSSVRINLPLALRTQAEAFATRYPNVRVFDFQPLVKITHDYGNYFDYYHFDQFVTDQMVADIGAGRRQVGAQDLRRGTRQILNQLARLCTECVVRSLDRKIDEALRSGRLEDEVAQALRAEAK